MKITLSLAIVASLFCGSVTFAEGPVRSADQGTIRVTVLDNTGAVVEEAPVYIYGEKRSQFVGGADIPGSTTFSMKEGKCKYRISSAMIKRTGEYIDRYATNEAIVNVVAGDNVSVVLTLKPLENPDQQPLSYATLHVAGIPTGLLNNN
jgi:hypothetical protein